MNTKPNIIFIITDQQRYDTIAALGFPYMETPVLDKLVEEGTSFTDMIVSAPSCGPSRASLFSGTYPHTNGVFRNNERWSYSWVGELAKVGYRCVNVGKMHTFPPEAPYGFHERHVTENKDRPHVADIFHIDNWDKALDARGIKKPGRMTYCDREDYDERLGAFVWEPDDDMHCDNFVPQMACTWIDRYKGKDPFFLQIGIPGPHPPYDPTQEYLDKYIDKTDLPKPIRDDVDRLPVPLQELRDEHCNNDYDAVIHLKDPTDEQMHLQRAHYFANVSMIDTQVGEVIEALKRRGVYENTIIIFTSDHGDCLCDHSQSQKWAMYEQSVKVPAIIFGAGIEGGGKKVDDLVSLMDLGPTILELGGARIPEWMEAQSLAGFVNGGKGNGRERLFAEQANDVIVKTTSFSTMVREKDWKLVYYVDHDDGLLINMKDDPTEINNLWDDPEHQVEKMRLIREILNWRIESSKTTQRFQNELAGGRFEVTPDNYTV